MSGEWLGRGNGEGARQQGGVRGRGGGRGEGGGRLLGLNRLTWIVLTLTCSPGMPLCVDQEGEVGKQGATRANATCQHICLCVGVGVGG